MHSFLVNYLLKSTVFIIFITHTTLTFAQISPPLGTKTYGQEYDDRVSQIFPTKEDGYSF